MDYYWLWFWAAVLVLTLVFYAGLVVVVTIGGFKDIIAMFKNLDRQHRESSDDDPTREIPQ